MPVGVLPTLAADALFHNKVTLSPVPSELPNFMTEVEKFARGPYAIATGSFPKVDPVVLQFLSDILGIPAVVLKYWKLDRPQRTLRIFLTSLRQDEGPCRGLI